jgi:hypothetical protein
MQYTVQPIGAALSTTVAGTTMDGPTAPSQQICCELAQVSVVVLVHKDEAIKWG